MESRPTGARMPGALLVLLIVALLLPAGVLAQDGVTFTAEVDQTALPAGGQLTLTLTVSGARSVPEPKLPALSGLQVYSSGRSQQISIVNGKMTSSVAFTYLLVATSEGTFTIEPAEISIGGQVYRTQPITVRVAGGVRPTQPPAAAGTPSGPAPALGSEELFVDMVVDKPSAYLGEQITLSFRFFQRVNLVDQPRYTPPSLSGFWTEQMSPQAQGRQTINGRSYVVTELKTALFPTTAGEQSIGSATLEIRDFLAASKMLTAAPLTVQVKLLPEEGRPADFNGAVGRYQVAAWIEPQQTRAGEPFTLFFKVSGKGNIQNVPEPAWDLPEGMRSYDAKSSSTSSYADYVVQGEKVFEKLIVPEKVGDYILAPLALSYFDPQAGAYQRAESEPLMVSVAVGAAEPATTAAPGQPAAVARDIRHIKPAPGQLQSSKAPIYRQGGFWLLWIVPGLALLAGLAVQMQSRRLRQDPRYARLRRSHRMARQRLQRARAHMAAGEAKAGCTAIAEALVQYVADKTDRPAAGLTEADILATLGRQGASAAAIDRFSACWERCDQGRFAPASMEAGALASLLADAEELIVELEELAWHG